MASGPEAAFRKVEPLIKAFAPGGVSYVGEGELARVCKIAHNVMLGVVIENLIEITLLANKMGVPRHAFLAFINNSAMGSMFTRYKSPALVNLDWTTTFTPELLRKDIDLGLALGRDQDVPMPVTAAAREVLQTHFGAATLQARPGEVPRRRLRRPDRDHGARRRHEAREREAARAHGLGGLIARNKKFEDVRTEGRGSAFSRPTFASVEARRHGAPRFGLPWRSSQRRRGTGPAVQAGRCQARFSRRSGKRRRACARGPAWLRVRAWHRARNGCRP